MNWMRFKWLYFIISALVLGPGLVFLFLFGLRPAIDFTGGTLLEYRFNQFLPIDELKSFLEESDYQAGSVQEAGENTYLIRTKPLTDAEISDLQVKLAERFEEKPETIRSETIGPTLGKELLKKTLTAVVLATLAILAYTAWQFKDKKFGVCAVLAMFHDTFILLGSFSLLGHFFGVEVDTLFVTAVLTILSFSIHDTVVIYNRIRETQRLLPSAPFSQIANQAVSETIVRSLNNSLTIIFMLIALLLLGGETIRWFVVAFLIGTLAGTFSSTFTAVPLLVVWENLKARKK